jgi:DNA helicase HerA-like ATPase
VITQNVDACKAAAMPGPFLSLDELYYCDQADLLRHAAFLGGTGSGKTTLALNVIEQLLMAGIPALLVDRKGDLCTYGHKAAWEVADDPCPIDGCVV